MTNQNKQFWLLGCFVLAGLFLSAGKMEAQEQIKPGNVSSTVELWLKADQGVITDEDNVTGWTDQSGNGRNYNGLAPNNFPTFNETTYLMNFQPSIDFRGTANPNNNQKLISASNHFLNASNAYYVFYVSQQAASTATFATVYAFNAASGGATRNDDYGWLNGKPVFRTATATTFLHQGNGKLYGINAVMLPNSGTLAQQSYMNGVINSPAFGAATLLMTTPGVSVIGTSNAGIAGTDIFKGNVQEIIILSGPVRSYIPGADLKKINSYLAIKYGITLDNADDYVDSDGITVWNRTANGMYNKNIFGIGRDHASGLNQVQSRSMNSDTMTIFKGTLNDLNDNSSEELPDKTFLMIGSNGMAGINSYIYAAGNAFSNAMLTDKINYIQKNVYKAQVTTNGVANSGSQTVSMKISGIPNSVKYVLVSSNPLFPAGSAGPTRIYPVVNQIATDVLINHGDYIVLAGYQATPGGITDANANVVAWLSPESYNSKGTWTNLIAGASSIGDFKMPTGATVWSAPASGTAGGYNFHPVVMFDKTTAATAPNRLNSNQFDISATEAVTAIFVLQKSNTLANNSLIGFTTTTNNTGLWWATANNDNLTFGWNASRGVVGAVKDGILTVDNSNIAATALQEGTRFYTNGLKIPYASYNWNNSGVAATNRVVALGSGQTSAASNGFQGNLQEVILIKKSGNAHIAAIDMQKIHSYLAVKYGITLNNSDNYINSNGDIVWNKSKDTNYNKNIFGIGRDDLSGLNQVQSRCADNDIITLFVGAFNELNDNFSKELPDKAFLMLGSNELPGNTKYEYPANAQFKNDKIADKINYRSNFVYMAQGTGFNQPVNIKVNYPFANYILVSDKADFPASSTNIYPINGQVAAGVAIDDTYKYIAISGYEAKPGGIDLGDAGYSLDLWVDGNHSTDASWKNLVPATFSLEKFSTYAPVVRNSRFNFNKEMYFGNATSSKLRTSANYSVTPGNTYQAFIVSDAGTITANSLILTYNTGTTTSANLFWNNSTTNVFSTRWNTTARNPYFASEASARYGITTLNVVNTNSRPLEMYFNGRKFSDNLGTNAADGAVTSNTQMIIANGSGAAGAGSTDPFNGAIQEIILVRSKSGSTNLMPGDMIAKIHSYLAIKYGITLTTGDYVNSGGNTVWSRTGNSGYSANIFGIARDDDSGLYQKQSHSTNDQTVTVFVGAGVAELNSDNTGTLDDRQFVMIARNNGDTGAVTELVNAGIINNGQNFANGPINSVISNVQSPRYKVQLTSALFPVKVKLTSSSDPFKHVIVSKNDAFNNKSEMKVYEMKNGVAEVEFDNDFKFFKFIGSMEGPGGVSQGLLLWLQADDPASLSIVDYPITNQGLSGYGFAKNPEAVPTVDWWKDMKRGHTWTYAAGGTNASRRRPVFESSVREMNYHPAARFWGSGGASAYLSNISGIASTNPLTNTAFFMMNNNFNTGARVYQMHFTTSPAIIASGTNGNIYGIEKETIGGVNVGLGRYRGPASSTGSIPLFTVGNTAIASYYIDNRTNKGARFRFNGKEDFGDTYNGGTDGLNLGSTIGKGYSADRTIQGFVSEVIIYDRIIDEGATGADNRDKVESYLALKYGVTLRPFPYKSTESKFDYEFSSGKSIWQGQTGDPKFSTFYNRVAAVIRDDIASLDNKHSISTNIGSLLHLGVAGTALDANGAGSVVGLNNLEAVAFGDNDASGFTEVQNEDVCGGFDSRFNRIWLIHKKTENDRPIKMIVGVQDNSDFQIGNDPDTKSYYERLNGTYDVSMIVAGAPEDIQDESYKRVIPMTYINGVWQCMYEFSDEDTYITFGTKPNNWGCIPDEESVFAGVKTFSWTQWTSRTNRSAAPELSLPATPFPPVDLGDNIQVTETHVTYPAGVRANTGYPRSGSIPVRSSLEVHRSRGAANQDVVVTITFNHPVTPEFSISGLDCYGGYAYEEVEITGECPGCDDIFVPKLSYAVPRITNASYRIDGNKATVTKRGTVAGANKNGMVNVKFISSVSTVTIKYRVLGRVPATAMQRIYISPITFKTVPPPPPVNEDGLSFVKDVKKYNITTCEPVEYSFYIRNTNCDSKTVCLKDTLPAKMKWDRSSFVLDTISNNMNPAIEYEVFPANSIHGETLQIDGLQLPGATTLVLTASAVLDEDAPGGNYDNHATVSYDLIVEDIPTSPKLESLDRYTLDPNTSFTATWQQPLKQVGIEEKYSLSKYKENNEIEVTYTINNPNPVPVTDMFLDVDFNEEFTYVDKSFPGGGGSLAPTLTLDPDNPSSLSITGSVNGADGFTLPPGETVVTFKLKAPDANHLHYELDDAGQPTDKKVDLNIIYNLSSTMDDPCAIETITGLASDQLIPYSKGLKYILSNKNVTSKIK